MRPRSAFLLAAVCATTVSAVLDTAKYDRSHELKAEHMKIYWKIEGETLKLALEAEATGWVGFGLGETTGMQGADVVYFEKASNTLTDAYVTATNAKPNPDKVPRLDIGGVGDERHQADCGSVSQTRYS